MSSTIPLPLAKWLQKEKVLPRRAPEVYPAPGYEKKLLTVKGSTWVKFQNGYAVALLLRGLEANPKYEPAVRCRREHAAKGVDGYVHVVQLERAGADS